MRELAQSPEHRRRFEKLLLLAAERGDADQVEERLGWGIDPNCKFRRGRTPLIANVRGSCPSAATIAALVRHGADPALADESGMTALDYARRKLAVLNSRPRRAPRKSPSLDENDQLVLSEAEQAELDKMREELGDDGKDFIRVYWRERLRAARRVFNDPQQIEAIIELLESCGGV